MVSACSTRHQTGDTDSFQLAIPLTVQLDSQGTFVPCEARIVWYSAGRTSSRQLRDTTHFHLYPRLKHHLHAFGGLVHGAHTLWYFPWEAFIIEGLKNLPEQGREAWLPGRLRTFRR